MTAVGKLIGKGRWWLLNRRLTPVGRAIGTRNLTYLAPDRRLTLLRELRRLRGAGVPGAALEFGVALGGSAAMLADACRGVRPFLGYDVFATIPPPGPRDPQEAHDRYATILQGASGGIGGETYYGYRTDLLNEVRAVMDSFRVPEDGAAVTLVPGLFEVTLPQKLPAEVALAHVDCDWHDPVQHVLAEVAHRMVPGGAFVIDDYNDFGGARSATDAFLAANPDFRIVQGGPNLVIRRAG